MVGRRVVGFDHIRGISGAGQSEGLYKQPLLVDDPLLKKRTIAFSKSRSFVSLRANHASHRMRLVDVLQRGQLFRLTHEGGEQHVGGSL